MTEATALTKLQEVDLALLKHASTLSAMPQRKRLKTIELAKRKVASELTGIVGQRKDVETEIADAEEALAHYREKTVEVQAAADAGDHTHREIRDFEQQLTSLATRIESGWGGSSAPSATRASPPSASTPSGRAPSPTSRRALPRCAPTSSGCPASATSSLRGCRAGCSSATRPRAGASRGLPSSVSAATCRRCAA